MVKDQHSQATLSMRTVGLDVPKDSTNSWSTEVQVTVCIKKRMRLVKEYILGVPRKDYLC